MANVFTLRNLGIAARVAARQVAGSRRFSPFLAAGRTMATHFGRVLHLLWLEVTGFTFLALASIGAAAFVREWAKHGQGKAGIDRVLVAAAFTVMFAWFGISSFWRVRKKNMTR